MVTQTSQRWSVGSLTTKKIIFENKDTGENGVMFHQSVPINYSCLDGTIETWEVKMTPRGFLINYPDSIVEGGRGFYRKPEDRKVIHNRESSLTASTLLSKLKEKFGIDIARKVGLAFVEGVETND